MLVCIIIRPTLTDVAATESHERYHVNLSCLAAAAAAADADDDAASDGCCSKAGAMKRGAGLSVVDSAHFQSSHQGHTSVGSAHRPTPGAVDVVFKRSSTGNEHPSSRNRHRQSARKGKWKADNRRRIRRQPVTTSWKSWKFLYRSLAVTISL